MKDFYIHYNYFTATTPFGLFFLYWVRVKLALFLFFQSKCLCLFLDSCMIQKIFSAYSMIPFLSASFTAMISWLNLWRLTLVGGLLQDFFFSLLNLAEELWGYAEIVFSVSLVTDIFSFRLLKTVGERTGLGYSFFFFFLKSGNSTFSLKLPWFLCQSNRFGQAVQELDFLVSTTAERVAKKRGLETREDL